MDAGPPPGTRAARGPRGRIVGFRPKRTPITALPLPWPTSFREGMLASGRLEPRRGLCWHLRTGRS
jgi:hypothetical protein